MRQAWLPGCERYCRVIYDTSILMDHEVFEQMRQNRAINAKFLTVALYARYLFYCVALFSAENRGLFALKTRCKAEAAFRILPAALQKNRVPRFFVLARVHKPTRLTRGNPRINLPQTR